MRRSQFAALCSAVVVAACSKGDATADSTRMTDSTASTTTATSMAPAAPAMTDANILAMMDEANMADSAGGSMASMKGTSAEVKSFGREMMRDHHALRKAGMDLSKKANMSPAMPTGDVTASRDKAMGDSMTAAPKGAAWDKWYIDHTVMHHQEVLTMAQNAANTTQNADLKALLEKAAPNVQAHLDHAKSIQSKMGGAMGGAMSDTTKKKK